MYLFIRYGKESKNCTYYVYKRVLYRVNKKSLCTWWLQYRKLQVMFKVSPANLQDQEDTRLKLTPSVIPNSNYVVMVSDWNCLKYFCLFFNCNHQVHRDFLITLYYKSSVPAMVTCLSYICTEILDNTVEGLLETQTVLEDYTTDVLHSTLIT
jgi:hypothetical protein